MPTPFLNSERIRAWTSILFIAEFLFSLACALVTHGVLWPHSYKPSNSDFTSFYSAGTLANAGHPDLAYDQPRLFLTEQSITHASAPKLWFFYPPVYLMLCRLLALPGYIPAFYLCALVGVGLYLWTITRIWPERRSTAIMVAACLPPTFLCIGVGQNAFLSAALFGLGLTLLQRRPLMAGMVLGLLCYKPHFGLLLPIALACNRKWRTMIGATLSVCLCIIATLIMFGPTIWLDYIHATAIATQTFRDNVVPAYNLINLYATCLSFGLHDRTAHMVQAAAMAVAAGAVIQTWAYPTPQDLRYAILVAATLVTMPVVLYYDLVTLSLAGFWLARDMVHRGAKPGEYAILVLIPPFYIFLYAACLRTHYSLGAIVPLLILTLTCRRVLTR